MFCKQKKTEMRMLYLNIYRPIECYVMRKYT